MRVILACNCRSFHTIVIYMEESLVTKLFVHVGMFVCLPFRVTYIYTRTGESLKTWKLGQHEQCSTEMHSTGQEVWWCV